LRNQNQKSTKHTWVLKMENSKEILAACRGISNDISDLKKDFKREIRHVAKIVATEAVKEHEKNCKANNEMFSMIKKVYENSGIVNTISKTSFLKNDKNKIANWVKVTASVTALLGAITGLLAYIF
jgi:hypothetical protein